MRFFLILLMVSCSNSSGLKYRFNATKPYLPSFTDESVEVSRIEISFKNPVVFASGLDSTHINAKLYDKKGNQLFDVDPMDLTLSGSQELEATPFILRQGVYRSDLLPRVKSPNISMQVDWRNKVKSKIKVLKLTTAPAKDKLRPFNHEYVEAKSHGEVMVGRGSRFPASGSEEFSFVNVGKNRIVKRHNSSRTFHFEYPEHARQNIAMEIDDAPNDMVSQTMHSYFMVFPRKQLPIVQQLAGTMVVTLANGEKLTFDKETKEIIDGVFVEGPLDINIHASKRHFPNLRYNGRGVILRANARGQSPQISQSDKEKIDMNNGTKGSREVLIVNGTTGEKCRRPKTDFWDSMDVSPIEFKFPTDDAFDIYLQNYCGFGLPKF